MTEPAAPAPLPKRKSIHRPSSATSRFHMSAQAVDRSVETYAKWSDLKCVQHLARLRWGDHRNVPCAHCGTCAEQDRKSTRLNSSHH